MASNNAWGLAPDGEGWFLVGLSRDLAQRPRVHTAGHLAVPLAQPGDRLLQRAMQQAGLSRGLVRSAWQARPRVVVGLAAHQWVGGVLDLPGTLEPSQWQAEIQFEASRTLGLAPEHISFDFQALGVTDGLVVKLQWVACALSVVTQLNQSVRELGWQLYSIEPAHEAASRAAHCLRGGVGSVLSQPVQDWQFEEAPMATEAALAEQRTTLADDVHGLQDVLQSMAGPRLVASGLALRGLQ